MLIMSLSQWKEILLPSDCEALDEYFHDDQMELDSPSVLDVFVSYEGGIASGYEVRLLVDRVYGIDFGGSDHEKNYYHC